MKFGSFIAATIGIGALVGWMAPGRVMNSGGPVVASDEAARRLVVVQRDAWLAGEVVLPREADGHFYADVGTEGPTMHMLVDTGASVVALTAEDADAMGVAWDPNGVRPVARGASGAVYGVPVTIDRLQLGSLEAQGVEAIVVPEGLGVSLLGQSFLSKIDQVRIDGDRMILGG
jgi:aspartyl protease family protein